MSPLNPAAVGHGGNVAPPPAKTRAGRRASPKRRKGQRVAAGYPRSGTTTLVSPDAVAVPHRAAATSVRATLRANEECTTVGVTAIGGTTNVVNTTAVETVRADAENGTYPRSGGGDAKGDIDRPQQHQDQFSYFRSAPANHHYRMLPGWQGAVLHCLRRSRAEAASGPVRQVRLL